MGSPVYSCERLKVNVVYNKFRGALYVNGSGNSILTQITFEFDSLQFLLESGETFQAPYHSIAIGLGGFENRMVEVKGVGLNNELLVCYVDENYKDAFLQVCSHTPGISRFSVEKVIRKDRTARIIQFWLDWGLFIASFFGGIISLLLVGLYFYFGVK